MALTSLVQIRRLSPFCSSAWFRRCSPTCFRSSLVSGRSISVHSCSLNSNADSHRPRVDFSDAREAFKTMSTMDLIKSYLIYSLFKYDSFVNNSFKIMQLGQRLLGPSLFAKLMKATFYGQFAAGEDDEDIKAAFVKFRNVGIGSVLNYSVEEDESSGSSNNGNRKSIYDNSVSALLDSIKLTGDFDSDNGMIAIKLTGLCPTPILAKFSRCIVGGEQVYRMLADKPSITEGNIIEGSFASGMNKIGISLSESSELWQELCPQTAPLNIVNWKRQFLPHTNLYKTVSSTKSCTDFLPSLSDNELAEFNKALDRIDRLGQCALDYNVKILIDAEQSFYQPAIRYMAVNHMMSKYNIDKAIIYNTQQCYLKQTLNSILLDLHMADCGGYHYGVKIVRGAYMEQERSVAADKGYECPVWNTKDETNSNYYRILELMLNRVKDTPQDGIVVASHNEDTIHFAMDKINELDLSKTSGRVVFGQVMGMADHLAIAIAQAGYMAYKYMPYGPVEEVVPYLSRRAKENRGMLAGPVRERRILVKEIKRRLTKTS